MTVRIKLDTSDFTVERTVEGRIVVYIDGAEASAELDLDPGVAADLFLALANPEEVTS